MLDARFNRCYNETIVMTYEAVQVLIRLGDSLGRESRSAPRRSMDSLSQYMSRCLCKKNYDALRSVHHTTRV